MKEPKDAIGQIIENGDLIVNASKSADDMIFRVVQDAQKQTTMKINRRNNTWTPEKRVTRLYTYQRTLKVPDEIFVNMNPELFRVMVEVRKNLKLPTNINVQSLEALKRMLETI